MNPNELSVDATKVIAHLADQVKDLSLQVAILKARLDELSAPLEAAPER